MWFPAGFCELKMTKKKYNIFCLFFSVGLSVESLNFLGQTPLFVCCYSGDRAMTKILLDLGADPNTRWDLLSDVVYI